MPKSIKLLKIMKKAILFLIVFLPLVAVTGQTQKPRFTIPIKTWNLQLVSFNHHYPNYLADPLGGRFEVSIQNIQYGDIDFQDQVNSGAGYLGKQVIFPGVRVSLLRFSPKSNPNLGVSVDLGAMVPTFMRGGNNDLIGLDGIYYFAIAAKPAEWISLKFSKHHICTHVGDEFPYGTVKSPIDFDPNTTALPVRDDFIMMMAIRPLWFLRNPQLDILQVYGDFGFFMPGGDFMGRRANKPHFEAYLSYQLGAELEYYFKNPYIGGLYSAVNVSAYQLNSYAPNLSIVGGYLFPQERNSRRFRIGLQYYNGRCISNQFYNRKEKFVAFTVGFDI
ncbi:MAG: hypothetical protein WCW86_05990, partial [Bacteroidales bacterium]